MQNSRIWMNDYNTMKAVRIHSFGGPEVIKIDDIPVPEPEKENVVVEIRATAMNHLDLWVRRGGPTHLLPMTLGSDGAGIVHKTGSGVTRFKIGDEVLIQPLWYCGNCKSCNSGKENYCSKFGIFGEDRNGTQCEYFIVPERNLFHKPNNISFEEAAAFPLVGQTAYAMLVTRADIQKDETVLVWGAGSGIGSMAIQIAKHRGCRIIATGGTQEKIEHALEIGADYGINHFKEDVLSRIKEITNGTGVDVVFEHVGEATWNTSLRCMNKGGRLVTCGATTGPEVKLEIRHLFFKQQSIMGSTMGNADAFKNVYKMVENGSLKPTIDKIYKFEDAALAHEYLENDHNFGKVILAP